MEYLNDTGFLQIRRYGTLNKDVATTLDLQANCLSFTSQTESESETETEP